MNLVELTTLSHINSIQSILVHVVGEGGPPLDAPHFGH